MARSASLIRLLDGFAIERAGCDVTPSGQAAQLVKLVALHRGPVHVEQAAGTLWARDDAGPARARLRNVLLRLRAVSGGVVVRDGPTLRLGPDVTVDTHRFEQAARAAQAALRAGGDEALTLGYEALDRYAGDLLPGDPYAPWIAERREALAATHLALLDGLARATQACGDVDEAVRLHARAIAVEPYDEGRYLTAGRLLLETGRPAAAARLVGQAERRLADLGVRPSTTLQHLARAARDQGAAG